MVPQLILIFPISKDLTNVVPILSMILLFTFYITCIIKEIGRPRRGWENNVRIYLKEIGAIRSTTNGVDSV